MNRYTIAPVASLQPRAILSVFVATFGSVWLFVEPLGAFGLLPQFQSGLGAIGYMLIIVVSVLIVLFFIRGYRWSKTVDVPFVNITIESASDGGTYQVRAAYNMQVGEFVESFIDLLSKGPARERVMLFRLHHLPILQIKRNNDYMDVDSNLSLQDAGIVENDICQIRGELNPVFNTTRLSRSTQAASRSGGA